MDISTVLGLILGFVFMIVSIAMNGRLGLFIDIPSVMITFGGTLASMLVAYPMNKFMNSLKTIRLIFQTKEMNTGNIIQKILNWLILQEKKGY